MAGAATHTTTGMKAVAILIVWISAAQLDFRVPLELPKSGYGILVLATAIVGLAVAVGTWNGAPWMLLAYAIWLVLMLVARVWHDARLGADLWEIAVGAVIVTVLFGLVGYFLQKDQSLCRSNRDTERKE